jgi:hypothetical protein
VRPGTGPIPVPGCSATQASSSSAVNRTYLPSRRCGIRPARASAITQDLGTCSSALAASAFSSGGSGDASATITAGVNASARRSTRSGYSV